MANTKITFESPLSRVTAYSSTPLKGKYEQTMELVYVNSTESRIDWDIPDLDECLSIGIFHPGDMVIDDYDGVFDVPKEAIQLLKDNGYDVTYLTEE